ncbi:MAG: AraC family transcriptional regulator [Lachnospiraceae bacterium]|jgi:AraC-like DNA-binding protein
MEEKNFMPEAYGWPPEAEITRKKREQGFSMEDVHSHPIYELFYLTSGTCRVFIGHSIYYVNAGDFILIRPGQLHKTTYESSPVAERVTIGFLEPAVELMRKLCPGADVDQLFHTVKIGISLERRPYAEELFRKIEDEGRQADGYSAMLKGGYLLELLAFLGREGKKAGISESLDEIEMEIQKAADYLYIHYPDSLSLEKMAEQAHMSPAYFSKKFHKLTGFGFKEYLTHVRIEAAAKMLAQGEESITDIALSCGYSDGNYFGDVFCKLKGMSPRQYRNRVKRLDKSFLNKSISTLTIEGK